MPHILLYSVHSVAKKKKKSTSSSGKPIVYSNKSNAKKKQYDKPLKENTNWLAHKNHPIRAKWITNTLRASTLDDVTIKVDGKDVVVPTSQVVEARTVDISRLKSSQKKCGMHGQLDRVPAIAVSAQIIPVLEAEPFEMTFDLANKSAKSKIAQAKARGDSDPQLSVKFQIYTRRLINDSKIYKWEGYHLGLRPCLAPTRDRKNGVTPEITGAAFDPTRKIVLIHPYCTKDANVRKMGDNAVENPKWWPKSWD